MLRRGLDSVRLRLAAAERRRAELSARLSSLAEGEARLANETREARDRQAATAAQLADLPEASDLEAALGRCRDAAARDRQAVGEAKLLLQTVQSEALMRGRRLAAIAGERTAWSDRRTRAAAEHRVGVVHRRSGVKQDLLGVNHHETRVLQHDSAGAIERMVILDR
jgi:chromosome segregation protein